MNATTKIIGILVASGLLTAGVTFGQTTTFGSDNDGDGGFTTSAITGTEAWTVEAGSYNYAFGTTPPTGIATHDEAHTASLLRSYTLDKTPGSEYTIEGVLDLTNGYGDDNNRIGILLFNSTDTQTADGGGGLYLRLNTDDNRDISINSGINGGALGSTNTGVVTGDSWIGQTLTYTAGLTFKTGDLLDVSFTLTDQSNTDFTANATDIDATILTGTHFGFASKWRYRDQSSSARDVPAEFDYQSFSVTQTAIPEPSTLALLGLALGALMKKLRRRK